MHVKVFPLIAAASIALTSCASAPPAARVQYIPMVVRLPLPPRPVLPQIEASHIECLNDGTVRRILERDNMRRDYADQLELIIRSTHTKQEHDG